MEVWASTSKARLARIGIRRRSGEFRAEGGCFLLGRRPGGRAIAPRRGRRGAQVRKVAGYTRFLEPHAAEVAVAGVAGSRGPKDDKRDAFGLAERTRRYARLRSSFYRPPSVGMYRIPSCSKLRLQLCQLYYLRVRLFLRRTTPEDVHPSHRAASGIGGGVAHRSPEFTRVQLATNNPSKATQSGTEKGYDCARQDRQPTGFIIIGGALVPHEVGQDSDSLGRMFELFPAPMRGNKPSSRIRWCWSSCCLQHFVGVDVTLIGGALERAQVCPNGRHCTYP